MSSDLEQIVVSSLRTILAPLSDSSPMPTSGEFQCFASALESFVSACLAEIHPEWRNESFDGILPMVASKIAPNEVLIAGAGILIKDQTLVPMHLQMQIASLSDEITWCEFRVGEIADGKMKRVPYGNPSAKKIMAATANPDRIDWAYKIMFGEKQIA